MAHRVKGAGRTMTSGGCSSSIAARRPDRRQAGEEACTWRGWLSRLVCALVSMTISTAMWGGSAGHLAVSAAFVRLPWVVFSPIRRFGDKRGNYWAEHVDSAHVRTLFITCDKRRERQEVLDCVEFAKNTLRNWQPESSSSPSGFGPFHLVVQGPYYSMEWLLANDDLFESLGKPVVYFIDCMAPVAVDTSDVLCRGNRTVTFDPGLVHQYRLREWKGVRLSSEKKLILQSFAKQWIEIPRDVQIMDPRNQNILGFPGERHYLWNGASGVYILSDDVNTDNLFEDEEEALKEAEYAVNVSSEFEGKLDFKVEKRDLLSSTLKARSFGNHEYIQVVDHPRFSLTILRKAVMLPYNDKPVTTSKEILYVLNFLKTPGPVFLRKELALDGVTTLVRLECPFDAYTCINTFGRQVPRSDGEVYMVAERPETLGSYIEIFDEVAKQSPSVYLRTKFWFESNKADPYAIGYRNSAGDVAQFKPWNVSMWNSGKNVDAAFYGISGKYCYSGYLMVVDRRFWQPLADQGDFWWPADVHVLGFNWGMLSTTVYGNMRKWKGDKLMVLNAPSWSTLTLSPMKRKVPKDSLRFLCGLNRVKLDPDFNNIDFSKDDIMLQRTRVEARSLEPLFVNPKPAEI